MTPAGLEQGLRKVQDGIAYFGKGYVSQAVSKNATSRERSAKSGMLERSKSYEESRELQRKNSLSLNDVVIQDGKRGKFSKIFEICYD
jgi:NAD kinase